MTIREALDQKINGYYIGNRLILPFHAQIIKLIFDGEVYTELVGSKEIQLNKDPNNTSIYFKKITDLNRYSDSFKNIKLLICEWNENICTAKHYKIIADIEEQHVVLLKETDENDPMFIG